MISFAASHTQSIRHEKAVKACLNGFHGASSFLWESSSYIIHKTISILVSVFHKRTAAVPQCGAAAAV